MIWLTLVAAFVVFVAIGRVSSFRVGILRGHARVWDIWKELRFELPLSSARPFVTFVYIVTLLVFIAGSAAAIWLALSGPAEETDEIAAEQVPQRWKRLKPPLWLIAPLVLTAVVFGVLVVWDGPRDDVSGSDLLKKSGFDQSTLPEACLTFLDRAADLKSGALREGIAERTAAAGCSTTAPFLMPTLEAAAR